MDKHKRKKYKTNIQIQKEKSGKFPDESELQACVNFM